MSDSPNPGPHSERSPMPVPVGMISDPAIVPEAELGLEAEEPETDPRVLAVGLVAQHAADRVEEAAVLWDQALMLPADGLRAALSAAIGAAAAGIKRIAELEGSDHVRIAQQFALEARRAVEEIEGEG